MGFGPLFNLTALRRAKTLWSFGLSECSRVKYLTAVLKWGQPTLVMWVGDILFFSLGRPHQVYHDLVTFELQNVTRLF